MTQPPYGSDPHRPQDTPRSFPTYGRPDHPHAQQSGAPQAGTQWAAPGQPQTEQPSYGQPPQGQASYGPGYAPGQYPPAYGQPPAPYGYGYGYPGATGGTNGLATAALVTGIGGILFGLAAPVAIGLGIAALVQIGRRGGGGKGMAIAGLVIGSVVTLGYALIFGLVIAFGSSTDDDYGSPEPVSTYSPPTTYVEDLAVGECYDDSNEDGEAIRQPCSEPHDGEIIADVTLPAGPYPGDRAVRKAAQTGCATEFAKYVGIPEDESELEPAYWAPDQELWEQDNDRLVICAAYGPDADQLTGTVKNSRR